MLITREKLYLIKSYFFKVKRYRWFGIILFYSSFLLSEIFPFNIPALIAGGYLFFSVLRDYYITGNKYHINLLNLYDEIYEKNNYSNEKEIEKLLSIKAYFFFKYPFHKDAHQIYIYLKYFLFISYFMNKNYEKAYELVEEMDEFAEKYVIKINEEFKTENEKTERENERRRKWKRKEINLIPEIDYPKDYTKEEIEGKKLLFYLEDEKDEYAIKLKNLFLEKKKLYDKKPS